MKACIRLCFWWRKTTLANSTAWKWWTK